VQDHLHIGVTLSVEEPGLCPSHPLAGILGQASRMTSQYMHLEVLKMNHVTRA